MLLHFAIVFLTLKLIYFPSHFFRRHHGSKKNQEKLMGYCLREDGLLITKSLWSSFVMPQGLGFAVVHYSRSNS